MLSSTDDKARPVASARYPASLEDQSLQNGSLESSSVVAIHVRGGPSSAAEEVWNWEEFG